jgi:hypothetical protein
LAKLRDGCGDDFERESDDGGCSVAAEAEADGSAGVFRRKADGSEDV